jgi:site-specific recombinase XerD
MWNAQSHQIWQKSRPVAFNLASDKILDHARAQLVLIFPFTDALWQSLGSLVQYCQSHRQMKPVQQVFSLRIQIQLHVAHVLGYLTRKEMDALLNAHELSQWAGRRDHALLLTLYNTGARVSEITGLQRSQVQFGSKSFVQFKGKGRKERAVPL